mgnify:CR=1 FL=1
MNHLFFTINASSSQPFIAMAIHHGHALRPGISRYINITDRQRLREEDPFTGQWTIVAPIQVICFHSRFQVDLNRPREKAIYETPDDAWGIKVWKFPLPENEKVLSLAEYDRFYFELKKLLDVIIREFGYCIIYDLHSYNAIRDNKIGDSIDNPDINIGTSHMNRKVWGFLIDQLINDLRSFDMLDRQLDVRENVKFKGGYLTQWIYEQYGDLCCPIAIEIKKFFMNEITGLPDANQMTLFGQALQYTTIKLHERAKQCLLSKVL